MRGGFTSVRGAEAFLNWGRVVHHFVNQHQGPEGRTPAEMAEIHLGLGESKLIDLIKVRAEKSHHSLRGVVSVKLEEILKFKPFPDRLRPQKLI